MAPRIVTLVNVILDTVIKRLWRQKSGDDADRRSLTIGYSGNRLLILSSIPIKVHSVRSRRLEHIRSQTEITRIIHLKRRKMATSQHLALLVRAGIITQHKQTTASAGRFSSGPPPPLLPARPTSRAEKVENQIFYLKLIR